MAQVDLDVRQNRHQSLAALGPMAEAVLCAVTDRVMGDGRMTAPAGHVPWPQRPAMLSARAHADRSPVGLAPVVFSHGP
jgi:hypothetical protein